MITLRTPKFEAISTRLTLLAVLVLAVHAWVLQWFWPRRAPVEVVAPSTLLQTFRYTLRAPVAQPVATHATEAAAQRQEAIGAAEATAPAPPNARPEPHAQSVAVQPLLVQAPTQVPPAAPGEPTRGERPTAPTAIQLPVPVGLQFAVQARVRGRNMEGQSTWVWRHDGDHYDARIELNGLPAGPRVQSSVGRIGAEGLRPERFSDKLRNERAAHFERDQGQVVFSVNRPAAELVEGMQDRLSVVFQLAAMLAAAPTRFSAGTEVVVPVVSPREASRWSFMVVGDETLDTPQAGPISARHLARRPQREYEPTLDLWFDAQRSYTPARMRVTQANGDYVDQLWTSSFAP